MHEILNNYSIEKGHTDSMDIYAPDSHDFTFKNSEGCRVIVGKRLTKDKKARVQITIINSFYRDQDRRKDTIKFILND